MLQLPAESSRVATADQGQVHKEAKSHADSRAVDAHQHRRDQGKAGVHPEGQDPEVDRGDNSQG